MPEVEGGPYGSTGLGSVVVRPPGFDYNGQYHGNVPYQQAGGEGMFPFPAASYSRPILWLNNHNIVLRARHILGQLNVTEDQLSSEHG